MKHQPIDFLNLQAVNARYGDELERAMQRVVSSGWYLHGQETAAFEREFAQFVGVAHCIGVGNGLDALTLVLQAWKDLEQWDDGDEVIVPANTFVATALAVSRIGLRPVFCDCRLDDALLDVASAEAVVSNRTRCIIPVHMYGRVCDMRAVNELAARHGLKVLEDACQAHGACGHANDACGAAEAHPSRSESASDVSCRRKPMAGSLADAAAFSFYPGKNLGALGDGGAVTTSDDRLADYVRTLGNYGARRKYVHEQLGFNSRLDELQAAALRVKLRGLVADNDSRRALAQRYDVLLAGVNGLQLPPAAGGAMSSDCVYHIYPVRVRHRDRVQQSLADCGIQTLIHYPVPLHQQKAYAEYASLSFPHAELWARTELSLPISPVLTEQEVDVVAAALRSLLAQDEASFLG